MQTSRGKRQEKVCPRCNMLKPFTMFNRDKSRAIGIFPICKECYRNIDLRRSVGEEYRKRKTTAKELSNQRHPDRAKARTLARNNPQLKKTNCEVCGSSQDLHMHHDDYSKPLEVRTLCRSCHENVHHAPKQEVEL